MKVNLHFLTKNRHRKLCSENESEKWVSITFNVPTPCLCFPRLFRCFRIETTFIRWLYFQMNVKQEKKSVFFLSSSLKAREGWETFQKRIIKFASSLQQDFIQVTICPFVHSSCCKSSRSSSFCPTATTSSHASSMCSSKLFLCSSKLWVSLRRLRRPGPRCVQDEGFPQNVEHLLTWNLTLHTANTSRNGSSL